MHKNISNCLKMKEKNNIEYNEQKGNNFSNTQQINIDKIILILFSIFMFLPSRITFFPVSIFKCISVVVVIILIYLFISRKKEIKKAIKHI